LSTKSVHGERKVPLIRISQEAYNNLKEMKNDPMWWWQRRATLAKIASRIINTQATEDKKVRPAPKLKAHD
jgi:endonuclease III-like uncharacterized protein